MGHLFPPSVVRQGLALRRRSLYDRLRAIAGYDYTRRPSAVLVLTPSVWEAPAARLGCPAERLTTRFCITLNLHDCFVAVESRNALERRDLRLWYSCRRAMTASSSQRASVRNRWSALAETGTISAKFSALRRSWDWTSRAWR